MLTDEIWAFGFVFVLAILIPEFEPCHIVAWKTPTYMFWTFME